MKINKIKIGIIVILISIIGFLFTIAGIVASFNSVKDMQGTGKADVLANGIFNSMLPTAISLPFLLIGFVLLVWGIINHFSRSKHKFEMKSST